MCIYTLWLEKFQNFHKIRNPGLEWVYGNRSEVCEGSLEELNLLLKSVVWTHRHYNLTFITLSSSFATLQIWWNFSYTNASNDLQNTWLSDLFSRLKKGTKYLTHLFFSAKELSCWVAQTQVLDTIQDLATPIFLGDTHKPNCMSPRR